MKKLFALLLLIAGPALADPVEFTVIHPTQMSDDSAIVGTVYTAIDCNMDWIATVTSPATTVTVDLPAGTYACAAHSSLDVRGSNMGPFSAAVTFTVPPPPVVVVPPVVPPAVPATPKQPVLKVLLK